MYQQKIYNLFKEAGAIMEGHYLYTSGKHGSHYIQCAQVLKSPYYTEILVKELTKKLTGEYDLVIGPAVGGITLSYEIAKHYNVFGLFTEREDGVMKLRRGFEIPKGAKVLVVEDVVTTGGSVKEVIDVVEDAGGEVKDIAVLVDRCKDIKKSKLSDYKDKYHALLKLDLEAYEPDDCPLCEKYGRPIKPGSR
ncbi:orotate phosphoribosyltransferase [Natranaerobius trueperi]|uniref:Orotate phosphoribosyltransferase n=1 Tax=Natranaerobius trueperi TaxID=759412 RepID=A0A226BYJ7_9FIRM|nr:orotate phosphoribosyltransferase [Natranaerobius trueperi]OWZ83187.1 orotate phosphoribosyltransferase [Natranaerobius trueperi]